jgi:cytochrome c556
MKRLAKLTGGIAAVAMTAVLALPTAAQADNQDVIDYRVHIMKTMDEQTAAVGKIMSYAIPDDHFASHLEVIALSAQTALSSFKEEVQGGESLPAVWENWDDFAERMNKFSEGVTAAAKIAREQGKDAALNAAFSALTCKQCHDDYRKKD